MLGDQGGALGRPWSYVGPRRVLHLNGKERTVLGGLRTVSSPTPTSTFKVGKIWPA